MKNGQFSSSVTRLLLATLTLFVVSACNKETDRAIPSQTNATKEQPAPGMMAKASGTIGYLDENGGFHLVTSDALKAFYRETLHLGDDVVLEDPIILHQVHPETGQHAYAVEMRGPNNMSISTRVTPYETAYILNAGGGSKTCTCTPKSCTSDGCKEDLFYTNCKCTSCGGDCEKTSSSSTSMALHVFFQTYYATHM